MEINTHHPRRSERILIVDDEQSICKMIAYQLEAENFAVDMTTNSSEVVGLLSATQYDLLILDVNMPYPDGLTLLKQAIALDPFLAVLMLTAMSDARTATQAMREGACDYIVKPHRSTQLFLRVERALERRRLLQERANTREILEQRVQEQTKKLSLQSQELSNLLERLLVTYQATLRALEAALDVRDQSAPGHCRRVSKLAVALGKKMGFRGNDLVVLEHGALLHDIGKMGIPDIILMKPGPLTEDEWELMKKHPEIGCQIIGSIEFLQDALAIIRHHHEHFDGSGYPHGLKGEEIPILARIFSVVDAYDAQTNQRPYNMVLSIETALKNIYDSKSRFFDPQVVDTFVEMIMEKET